MKATLQVSFSNERFFFFFSSRYLTGYCFVHNIVDLVAEYKGRSRQRRNQLRERKSDVNLKSKWQDPAILKKKKKKKGTNMRSGKKKRLMPV